jgi:hypothetical protein
MTLQTWAGMRITGTNKSMGKAQKLKMWYSFGKGFRVPQK